jgi:hypothetical protein
LHWNRHYWRTFTLVIVIILSNIFICIKPRPHQVISIIISDQSVFACKGTYPTRSAEVAQPEFPQSTAQTSLPGPGLCLDRLRRETAAITRCYRSIPLYNTAHDVMRSRIGCCRDALRDIMDYYNEPQRIKLEPYTECHNTTRVHDGTLE